MVWDIDINKDIYSQRYDGKHCYSDAMLPDTPVTLQRSVANWEGATVKKNRHIFISPFGILQLNSLEVDVHK